MIKFKITPLTDKGKAGILGTDNKKNKGERIIKKLAGITAEEIDGSYIVTLKRFGPSMAPTLIGNYERVFKKLDLAKGLDYMIEVKND